MSLLRALPALDALKLTGDEAVGMDIVRRALRAPLREIAINAGVSAAIVVQKSRNCQSETKATMPALDRYCDMVAEGIIDPTKVVRTALQNAASISTLFLTTDAIVGKIPERRRCLLCRQVVDMVGTETCINTSVIEPGTSAGREIAECTIPVLFFKNPFIRGFLL